MKRKRTPASVVYWAAVFLLVALVLPASLSAQESRGRITGRVVDASKATVPGATVTVTDAARGSVVAVTTNEQGLFQVNYLAPGAYRVEVELAGFQEVGPGAPPGPDQPDERPGHRPRGGSRAGIGQRHG